jgi:hypothetical protein
MQNVVPVLLFTVLIYLGSIVKSLLSAVLILLLARTGSREQKAFV